MFLTMLMALTLSFTFSIMLTGSPLLLGAWILMTALLMSIFVGLTTLSWVGFLMFLIYVGGMLVMFAYFTAIQPNQYMQINNMLLTLMFTYLLFFMILMSPYFTLLTNMNMPFTTSILTLYALPNIPVLMFLATMLFLALVAVVKVSKSTLGPLRPFS